MIWKWHLTSDLLTGGVEHFGGLEEMLPCGNMHTSGKHCCPPWWYHFTLRVHLRLGKLVDVERRMGFISCSASSWLSWQLFFNLIFWPHCAVFAVLAPCWGFNPMLLPGEAQSLNYWTTREFCPLDQVRQRSTHSHRLRSYQSSAPTALEW